MDTSLSARLGAITNLVHGFIYFAPEAAAECEALGLRDAQLYFSVRAAPFGPVGADLVVATFFNFEPGYVSAGIDGVWDTASPQDIQRARMRAAGAGLRSHCPNLAKADIVEASEIAKNMIDGLRFEGKPLAAANRAVPEPKDDVERLWQRITVLREWRGDVHVAALVASPVNAVEALILHAATGMVPKVALVRSRQWSEEAWQEGVDTLVARGLINADESFTEAGRAFREDIEARTDMVCLALIDSVGERSAERLIELLRPIRRGLLDGGAFALMGR